MMVHSGGTSQLLFDDGCCFHLHLFSFDGYRDWIV
jgi:hypothetical protein